MAPPLVVIESPWSNGTPPFPTYARFCVRDAVLRGEAPYASHLLFTQPGILRDDVAEERRLGISLGFSWGAHADLVAVYQDFGITAGMRLGIDQALAAGRPLQYRHLPHLIVEMMRTSADDGRSKYSIDLALRELSNPRLSWTPLR